MPMIFKSESKPVLNLANNESYFEKWVDNFKKTASYMDAFVNSLRSLDIKYSNTWDDDTGVVAISLTGNNYLNHISVYFRGKTAAITAEDEWEISLDHLDKYDFCKYNLLKSTFVSDLRNERTLITFEYVIFLYAEPEVFSEYLLILIKKFDVELQNFVSKYSLQKNYSPDVTLPPPPSTMIVGI